ncbi:MAG: hypothetical protein LBU58_00805 [Clostridiales bacterium]|jgi:hypothetical protein|nr:hypothetical protein [Clostridiales bacterium]
MASLEMVDKLRERANVTFDEAKAALDAADGDILEALIYLEKQGKVPPPQGGFYSSGANGRGRGYGEGYGYGSAGGGFDDFDGSGGERGRRGRRRRARGRDRAYDYDDHEAGRRASAFFQSVARFLRKAFHIGNTTMFEVSRHDEEIIKVPLTVMVIAMIIGFHILLVLLLAGLFFGYRYRFSSAHVDANPMNSVLNSAADVADSLKENFGKHGGNE